MRKLISFLFVFLFAFSSALAEGWQDKKGVYAVINTSLGQIVCQLFDKETPKTVENFIGLANGTKEFIDAKTNERTKRRFYDGQVFHRVIPGFMIQSGDPLGTGLGGPGYRFEDEIVPSITFNGPGKLAMANTGRPGTNGSQFFITEAPAQYLDGKYTIFGQVAEGMDVVVKIARVARTPVYDKPVNDITITSIIIENGISDKPAPVEQKLKNKKVVFVLPQQNFWEEEYFDPKSALEELGANIVTVSISTGEITGMHNGKANAELLLDQIHEADYNGIVFVGGSGAESLWDNPAAQKLARDFNSKKKLVGAASFAPVILARAGILKKKRAVSFLSLEQELKNNGAIYSSMNIEADGNIITASGPQASKEFGKALADWLKKQR